MAGQKDVRDAPSAVLRRPRVVGVFRVPLERRRERLLDRGARITQYAGQQPRHRVDHAERCRRTERGAHNLFAFPAQSNFSGVQHPLELVDQAQARGWQVLLDAAALAHETVAIGGGAHGVALTVEDLQADRMLMPAVCRAGPRTSSSGNTVQISQRGMFSPCSR